MRLRYAHVITLVGYFGLMALMVIWHAWLHPPRHFPTALAFTTLPLLLPLRGLLYGRARTHLGAGLLMLLYFMHGVVDAFSNPSQRLLAVAEIVLSLSVFFAATLYARWAASGDRPAP